jgi:hypothetical protein
MPRKVPVAGDHAIANPANALSLLCFHQEPQETDDENQQ